MVNSQLSPSSRINVTNLTVRHRAASFHKFLSIASQLTANFRRFRTQFLRNNQKLRSQHPIFRPRGKMLRLFQPCLTQQQLAAIFLKFLSYELLLAVDRDHTVRVVLILFSLRRRRGGSTRRKVKQPEITQLGVHLHGPNGGVSHSKSQISQS